MKTLLAFILILASFDLYSEELRKLAEELLIREKDGLSFEPTRDENYSYGFLSDLTITEVTSSPKSYMLEGHIKHSNNGAPLERIPIYIGTDKVSIPKLAALTNSNGNFKFRLWIKEDERANKIQTTADFRGYLYAMGSFEKSLGLNPISTYTQRYSLKTLKEREDLKIKEANSNIKEKIKNKMDDNNK